MSTCPSSIQVRELDRFTFGGAAWGFKAQAVRAHGLGGILATIPLPKFRAEHGIVKRITGPTGNEEVEITTASRRWLYAATYPAIPEGQNLTGPAVIHATLTVLEGRVGIAVTRHDNHNTLVKEVEASRVGRTVDIYLDLPAIEASGLIVVRNKRKNGPSRVIIHELVVRRPFVRPARKQVE